MKSEPSAAAGLAGDNPLRDDEMPGPLLRRRFAVASIEKADVGDGSLQDDWYRYVLASGPAQITGYRRGTPEEVADYAESCAESFNLRNTTGKSARAPMTKKST